ncbi:rare lipoprotein A [Plectosphaerella plurivora]|uniref:Rare lipoprotein A n=1 Tax=Plectosphaerella plurivora TaxID=936078 RepID=A0A9P8VIC5_9PEZI|nr:rare lipoprotein A [Plectosphaerella plurivora]
MKFQTFLLAASAAPLAFACPVGKPSKTVTVVVTATHAPTVVAVPPASPVEPTPAPEGPKTTTAPVVVAPVAEENNKPAPAPAPAAPAPAPASPVAAAASGPSVSGKSTFYGGNVSGGTCSFTGYTIPAGLYGTAFSGSAWGSSANCGGCVKVTGPNGNSITAMIVDKCPECDEGHLDLFQNGFEKLGTLSAGIISTSYTFVDCGITSPIVLKNKSGTSPYWFSMQVVNASERVSKLEVSTDGGKTWAGTSRQDYNFFEQPSGFGTSSVDVRVTSLSGKTVVVKGVKVASDAQTTASSNF